MSNTFQSFQEAIRRDDVKEVMSLLEDIKGSTWSQNPLLTAHEHGSLGVAKAMARRWPELVTTKDQNGNTAICTILAKGDAKMVQFLGELNPLSCLVEDNSSMIPLQLAAINGHADVIRELIALCPESLERVTAKQETALHLAAMNGHSDVIRELVALCPESLPKVTAKNETALHLAVKNSQCGAFRDLLEETKKLNQEHLLSWKDDEGNTVLHVATVNKLIGIMKLLLLESFDSRTLNRVNSKNKKGQTALDLCYANSQDMAFKEIELILHEAGATRENQNRFPGQQYPQLLGNQNCMDLTRWPVETRNVLLVVLVMIAGAALTVTCNLPEAFLREIYLAGETLPAKDVISLRLPNLVYLMVFNSAGFLATMAAIVALIWPLQFRTILLFVVSCTCIVYIILVDMITPKFHVRVGACSISSIALVWLLALAFIFSGVAILKVGKYSILCFFRLIDWLWSKRTKNFRGNHCP